MNKIKEYIEELESLFDLCDASDAYESLQEIKKYIENLQSQLIKEANENKSLKSNWKSLKEWLEEQNRYKIASYNDDGGAYVTSIKITLDSVLTKMKELEGDE